MSSRNAFPHSVGEEVLVSVEHSKIYVAPMRSPERWLTTRDSQEVETWLKANEYELVRSLHADPSDCHHGVQFHRLCWVYKRNWRKPLQQW